MRESWQAETAFSIASPSSCCCTRPQQYGEHHRHWHIGCGGIEWVWPAALRRPYANAPSTPDPGHAGPNNRRLYSGSPRPTASARAQSSYPVGWRFDRQARPSRLSRRRPDISANEYSTPVASAARSRGQRPRARDRRCCASGLAIERGLPPGNRALFGISWL
jgi:hypothetical protein